MPYKQVVESVIVEQVNVPVTHGVDPLAVVPGTQVELFK